MSDGFTDVTDALRPVILSSLKRLAAEYKETPMEAGVHLRAVVEAALEPPHERMSLWDRAQSNPRLMEDLKGSDAHTELAKRWNTTEMSVRRARNKLC